MIKIMIWGTGKLGEQSANDCLPHTEIIAFVQSEISNTNIFLGKPLISGNAIGEYEHDFLVLANSFKNEILSKFDLSKEKIIIYGYWCKEHPVLFKSQKRYLNYQNARNFMPYISIQGSNNDIFITHQSDLCIAESMILSGDTYGKKDIDLFMSDFKCPGIFFDIGANIGTTSIYAHNNISNKMKYIAFEPIKKNYKLLKINCILNNCEDIITENLGISNTLGIKKMYICENNLGSCGVINQSYWNNVMFDEEDEFIPLDYYIHEKGILYNKIKYIWIDTEGHEPEVIEGAEETLRNSNAKIFLEWRINNYIKRKKYEKILNTLMNLYSYFICVEQYFDGNKKYRNIKELPLLEYEVKLEYCNIILKK